MSLPRVPLYFWNVPIAQDGSPGSICSCCSRSWRRGTTRWSPRRRPRHRGRGPGRGPGSRIRRGNFDRPRFPAGRCPIRTLLAQPALRPLVDRRHGRRGGRRGSGVLVVPALAHDPGVRDRSARESENERRAPPSHGARRRTGSSRSSCLREFITSRQPRRLGKHNRRATCARHRNRYRGPDGALAAPRCSRGLGAAPPDYSIQAIR
jgi:hypothetical protein